MYTLFPFHFTRRMLRTPFLASKQAQLCAICEHILDLVENGALFHSCWRYFDVYTLFPSHFTFRKLCMPVASSKEADLCEKCDNLLYFDDKLSVLTLLLEIFRRLNAISIAFYTPNATHAAFSVESIPTVRKMRPFTPF